MKTTLGRTYAWRVAWIAGCCLVLIAFHVGCYNDARFVFGALGFLAFTLCLLPLRLEWNLTKREIEQADSQARRWGIHSPQVRMSLYGGFVLIWMASAWWLCLKGTPAWAIYLEPSVRKLEFSADGKRLKVIGNHEKKELIEVWNWRRRQKVDQQELAPGSNDSGEAGAPIVVASADGQYRVELAADQRSYQVVDRNGQVVCPLGDRAGVRDFVFHPGGRHVAALYRELDARWESIVFWNITTGRIALRLATPELNGQSRVRINTFTFSPDGRYVAGGTSRRGPVSSSYSQGNVVVRETYSGNWGGLFPAIVYIWELKLR